MMYTTYMHAYDMSYYIIILLDSADSKSLIPLSFLADAPAACDAASEPVQVASLVFSVSDTWKFWTGGKQC